MELSFFIGRFHLVFVHLPIGFLLLAAMMQFLSGKKRFERLDGAITFSLFLGAVSAILAAICGWLLANNGAYIEHTLFLHRWLGIGVAILAGFCWLLKTKIIKTGNRVLTFSITSLAILIFYTGHLGGNLTHGKSYLLQYAPDLLKTVFGLVTGVNKTSKQFSKPDSTLVFNDLLLPFLKEKCGDCHDEKDKKGGLNLTTKKGFLKGGEHDEIFFSGNAYESEIFKRVTLPGNDKKFMPPGGDVLSYDQIRLLEWWINEGAPFEKAVADYDLPKDIKTLFEKKYGLETKAKSFVETLIVSSISASVLQKLEAQNFKVTHLAANNNLLEISLQSGFKNISNAQIETLLEAREQITWLNLGNAEILNDHLLTVQKLQNLTRLRLEQTSITDQGIAHLGKLQYLESLNLYGTSISDQSIEVFLKLPALKSIYLWQTKVSPKGLEKLKSQRPNLEVVAGSKMFEEK